MSQESVFQTSDGTARGTGGLSFFPSCCRYSITVIDNLLSFLFWLDLRRRKVHLFIESHVVGVIKPSVVCDEKRQTMRKPWQGGSPSLPQPSFPLTGVWGLRHTFSEKRLLPIGPC